MVLFVWLVGWFGWFCVFCDRISLPCSRGPAIYWVEQVSNSPRTACLCFLSVGIEGVCRPPFAHILKDTLCWVWLTWANSICPSQLWNTLSRLPLPASFLSLLVRGWAVWWRLPLSDLHELGGSLAGMWWPVCVNVLEISRMAKTKSICGWNYFFKAKTPWVFLCLALFTKQC